MKNLLDTENTEQLLRKVAIWGGAFFGFAFIAVAIGKIAFSGDTPPQKVYQSIPVVEKNSTVEAIDKVVEKLQKSESNSSFISSSSSSSIVVSSSVVVSSIIPEVVVQKVSSSSSSTPKVTQKYAPSLNESSQPKHQSSSKHSSTSSIKKVFHESDDVAKKPVVAKSSILSSSSSSISSSTTNGRYFIQVLSVTKEPNGDFLNRVTSNGFDYTIKDVNQHKRVMIGPFKSKDEAQNRLGKIKSNINSGAFIVKE
jgi:hypothetical protein